MGKEGRYQRPAKPSRQVLCSDGLAVAGVSDPGYSSQAAYTLSSSGRVDGHLGIAGDDFVAAPSEGVAAVAHGEHFGGLPLRESVSKSNGATGSHILGVNDQPRPIPMPRKRLLSVLQPHRLLRRPPWLAQAQLALLVRRQHRLADCLALRLHGEVR